MKIKIYTSQISILITILALSIVTVIGASGDVDTTFEASLIKRPADRAIPTIIQPDGKIITHGNFQSLNGEAVPNLVRLNVDGTTDTTFNAAEISPTLTSSGLGIRAIELQSDGKIIIGGVFTSIDGQTAYSFARLNSDGSRDTTFVYNSLSGIRDVKDLVVLPNDSILLVDGTGIHKFNADGSTDATFQSGFSCGSITVSIALQSDGKILKLGDGGVKRCNADGSPDKSFTSATINGSVIDIAVQNDGKILVGGGYTTVNGFSLPNISRYNSNGTVDSTFSHNFATNGIVTKVIPLTDGKIYLGGISLHNTSASVNNGIYRLNNDGSVDNSFTPIDGNGSVWNLNVQTDGKVVRSSIQQPTETNITAKILNRLNTDGSEDTTFVAGFGTLGIGREVFVQPNGKILVGGSFTYPGGIFRSGIVRFNSDGTIDPSLNANFNASVNGGAIRGLDTQPDGKIIVGIDDFSVSSRRLNSDGTLDVVFPSSSAARDVRVLSNGKILIVGNSFVRRYNSNGSFDSTFSTTVNSEVNKFVIQPDGKIIIVGNFSQVNSINRGRIARLNADGTVDTTFNPPGGASSPVYDIALQSDGKIIIGGAFTGVNFETRNYLARLNSDGSLDTSFIPTPDLPVYSVKVQADDKVLVGGLFNSINETARKRFTRLNSNGSLDTSFNPNLSVEGIGGDALAPSVNAIDVQGDGNIIIAGQFTKVNGQSHLSIARILNNTFPGSADYDFDGDGKADIAVFRPSENKWYVLRSSDFGVTQQVFGVNGDSPVASDFDGDGKTDFSIFRNSLGDWWSLSSSNGNQSFTHLGSNGDIPRPTDFDGDGKADHIVYRPTDFFWYRVGSTGVISNTKFGTIGDKPVIGDFDGDGRSDLAIYRPSDGFWWYQSSIDNSQRATKWGLADDIPTPGDYDGDGITDLAVYRPSQGVWYILKSSSGNVDATIIQFGIAEDKPVPADYDGDGKVDIAVYRTSTGVWYLLKSTEGFAAYQFGISTDIPIPNALIP